MSTQGSQSESEEKPVRNFKVERTEERNYEEIPVRHWLRTATFSEIYKIYEHLIKDPPVETNRAIIQQRIWEIRKNRKGFKRIFDDPQYIYEVIGKTELGKQEATSIQQSISTSLRKLQGEGELYQLDFPVIVDKTNLIEALQAAGSALGIISPGGVLNNTPIEKTKKRLSVEPSLKLLNFSPPTSTSTPIKDNIMPDVEEKILIRDEKCDLKFANKSEEDIGNFIERYEIFSAMNDWPEEKKIKKLGGCMEGTALTMYAKYVYGREYTWCQIKQKLVELFGKSEGEYQRKLLGRKYLGANDWQDLVEDVKSLSIKIDPKVSEKTIVETIKEKLPKEIRKTMLMNKRPKNLEELRQAFQEYQEIECELQKIGDSSMIEKLNEIKTEIAELKSTKSGKVMQVRKSNDSESEDEFHKHVEQVVRKVNNEKEEKLVAFLQNRERQGNQQSFNRRPAFTRNFAPRPQYPRFNNFRNNYNRGNYNNTRGGMATFNNNRMKCYSCGKPGHYARTCWAKPTGQSEERFNPARRTKNLTRTSQ